jgi:hypothetical protein
MQGLMLYFPFFLFFLVSLVIKPFFNYNAFSRGVNPSCSFQKKKNRVKVNLGLLPRRWPFRDKSQQRILSYTVLQKIKKCITPNRNDKKKMAAGPAMC